jgi:hypothetical protein
MTNVVLPASNVAIDSWMSCSLSVSRLLVAGSIGSTRPGRGRPGKEKAGA